MSLAKLIDAFFLLSPLVPLLDKLMPGPKHAWKPARVESTRPGVPCAPLSVMPTVPSTP